MVESSKAVANYIRSRGAHDDDTAAVGWNGWVGALIEYNRVVFDVTIVAEPKVTDAAAVTGAQVAADPIVVELVVVGAGAEADATCPRRRGRDQIAADGGVQGDIVVMNAYIHVLPVRQYSIRYRSVLAGARSRV